MKDQIEEYFKTCDVNQLKLQKIRDMIEKPLITEVMKHTKGNKIAASIILGISTATLYVKLKRYGFISCDVGGGATDQKEN